MHDIVTYLATPFYLHFISLNLVTLGLAFFELYFIKLRFEQLESLILVVQLAAGFRVFYDNACRVVTETYSRFYLIDILSSSPTGAHGLEGNISWVDLYLYSIICQGVHIHRSKRGMSLSIAIKRRDTHQAMYTILPLEIAKGKFAIYL